MQFRLMVGIWIVVAVTIAAALCCCLMRVHIREASTEEVYLRGLAEDTKWCSEKVHRPEGTIPIGSPIRM